jgi:hypothetical protein
VKKAVWITGAVLLAIFLGLALYSASLLFSESLYSSRGSLAYWLTISSAIKSVPEIRPASSARFYASAGDGPKLPESAVSYRSLASAEEVIQAMDRYLTARGYHKRSDGAYERGVSIVSVQASAERDGTEVTVRENY